MEGSLPDTTVLKKRKCLQSRNILSLMNYAEGSKQHIYLKKHLEECAQCNDLFSKAQRENELIEIAIPSNLPSMETQNELQREIGEMINNLDLKPAVKSKRIFQKLKDAVQLILKV